MMSLFTCHENGISYKWVRKHSISNFKRKLEDRICTALSAVSGELFQNEIVLTYLMPKKPVALRVVSTNIAQKASEVLSIATTAQRTEFMIAPMVR